MAEMTKSEEKSYTKVDRQVKTVPRYSHDYSSSDNDDDTKHSKFDEWTESKRKVNHKTRQVETRVQRQLVMEDGKVIADSGPQVVTRIKEDNKVEESEKKRTPTKKNGKSAKSVCVSTISEDGGKVLGEKKEIQRVCREVREENMQYHDENLKELSGHDVHQKALKAPNELITITNKSDTSGSDDNDNNKSTSRNKQPRGKMVHYSAKGKKYQDTDEILEVSKLAIDGSVTTEVKRTRHHEEFSDDEKPDDDGEAEALREKPTVTRSSRRHFDYVNDFNDTNVPSGVNSSDDENEQQKVNKAKKGKKKSPIRSNGKEAFPRYSSNPLLGEHKIADQHLSTAHTVKPDRSTNKNLSRSSSDSDDISLDHRKAPVPKSQLSSRTAKPTTATVEIPEEYRLHRQQLLAAKNKAYR